MKQIYPLKAKQLAALFLFISSILCNIVNAQPESFLLSDDHTNLTKEAKIRYIDDTTAVGYYTESSMYAYFQLIDLNNVTILGKIKIDSAFFFIRDFRVLNDTVYACGTRLRDTIWRGVLLKFPISCFSSKSRATIEYTEVNNTTELTRMVVYKNDAYVGCVEIVAIGYKKEVIVPYSHVYGRIVDWKSTNMANYMVREAYHDGNQRERLDDIVLTHNYVGIIGSMSDGTICMRRALRNSTNILTGLIDTIYVYALNCLEPISYVYATETHGDSMASASIVSKTPSSFGTRIRQYYLQDMSMFEAVELMIGTKGDPEELAYNDAHSTILMLMRFPLEGSGSDYEWQVVTQWPATPSDYLTYYIPEHGFSSIASSKTNHNFLLTKGKAIAMKNNWTVPSGGCFGKSFVPKEEIIPAKYSIIYDDMGVTQHNTNWPHIIFSNPTPESTIICVNP